MHEPTRLVQWPLFVNHLLSTEWVRELQKKGKSNYINENIDLWGKGIYSSKKTQFPPYLHNTQHNISIHFWGYSPKLWTHKVRHLGSTTDLQVEASRTCKCSTLAVRKCNLGEVDFNKSWNLSLHLFDTLCYFWKNSSCWGDNVNGDKIGNT